jgi:hypothetical protein
VTVAGRDDAIEHLRAGRDGALGTLGIGHERADPPLRARLQGRRDDLGGIRKLRERLRRHEARRVDLRKSALRQCGDPSALGCRGHDLPDELETVARSDLADVNFAHDHPRDAYFVICRVEIQNSRLDCQRGADSCFHAKERERVEAARRGYERV